MSEEYRQLCWQLREHVKVQTLVPLILVLKRLPLDWNMYQVYRAGTGGTRHFAIIAVVEEPDDGRQFVDYGEQQPTEFIPMYISMFIWENMR